MPAPLPIVLVPGLNCSARLYADQVPALWRFGPVQVADHTRADSMDAIAADILAHAPPRFALAGLSMGGYIALTMLRQAPARVAKLALLDTSARPETSEQSQQRKPQIAFAQGGDHFGRDFLRRNHLPKVDRAVFVFVDAPTRAGGI